jgi:hypothetical protein
VTNRWQMNQPTADKYLLLKAYGITSDVGPIDINNTLADHRAINPQGKEIAVTVTRRGHRD